MAPPPARPAPAPSRTGLFAGVASVVALLVVAAIAIGVIFVGANVLKRTTRTAGPVEASTSLTSTSGKAVFSDDFRNSSSGWTTTALPSGTTFQYAAEGYVVVARGTLDHFAASPYSTPVAQIAISVTATQSADAPVGAGYGVSCWRGTDTSELRYDFVMTSAGDWTIDRRDGGVLTKPLILKQGTSKATLGGDPLAIEGMCVALADEHSVRLVMFAGKAKIADITDSANALPDAGWQADLMLTSSEIHASIVTVMHFEIRDLQR
ncbi:MAG TPA: hypothetical protein VGJ79_08010 [Candidatus Dormibacteraeota bacterium]|jgi:hypothetical protein